MIIMFEGPDGVGKSTLIKKFYKKLKEDSRIHATIVRDGEQFIPTNPNKPNRLNKHSLNLVMNVMASDINKVYLIDRGPISDCIYRVFDDEDPIVQFGELLDITNSNKYQYHDTVYIYCKSDSAEEDMLRRGEDNPIALRKHKELTKLYELVFSVLNRTNVVETYNRGKTSFKKLYEATIEQIYEAVN